VRYPRNARAFASRVADLALGFGESLSPARPRGGDFAKRGRGGRRAPPRYSEMHADARSAASAIGLVVDIDWPPRAVTVRALDLDGREVRAISGTQT
jgi:hypothetical protein